MPFKLPLESSANLSLSRIAPNTSYIADVLVLSRSCDRIIVVMTVEDVEEFHTEGHPETTAEPELVFLQNAQIFIRISKTADSGGTAFDWPTRRMRG